MSQDSDTISTAAAIPPPSPNVFDITTGKPLEPPAPPKPKGGKAVRWLIDIRRRARVYADWARGPKRNMADVCLDELACDLTRAIDMARKLERKAKKLKAQS